ncbi:MULTISPECIES: alpha/beta hydrolase [unclassified Limnobacter]|jgi:pimeloyl-ACP methyl ester carboxylesterase|uniref:alpha/beta fold hydrolase n=1 Tax=unclassified Limnobacter TaxID=2630203 RepID=UPI000C3E3467|nr:MULTISPECIES: alpha/beta hydrolase [unclassified Limnobacter]MAZ10003.1 alpha/beta hydrolase [Sutterellaceae bacterium]|tara:strand:- start:1470 stop:2330 length:861 start_codon:yes stop_codon:yes gene_type:complete
MELSMWKNSGQFFDWKGHFIFVQDTAASNKPVLLLIHGFPTASYDFHLLWPDLAETHRLIAFDMLGYGYSDKPRTWQHSIFNQADIAEALLKSKGVDECTMITHDVGDTVGQELLARHAEGKLGFRLKRVVMLNGGLFPETHRAILVQKLLLSPFGFVFTRFMKKEKLSASLRSVCSAGLSDADIDAAWTLMAHKKGNLCMHLLIQYMRERRENRDRWVEALQKADMPFALIDGVEDPISGEHMVQRFEELVPGKQTIRLAGLGHYPHLEDAAKVLGALKPLLDRQ